MSIIVCHLATLHCLNDFFFLLAIYLIIPNTADEGLLLEKYFLLQYCTENKNSYSDVHNILLKDI